MTERQNKIAAFEKLANACLEKDGTSKEQLSTLCKEASEKLSEAADKLSKYRQKDIEKTAAIESLKKENTKLQSQLNYIHKTAQVQNVVDTMVNKGMLRQSDAKEKTEELLGMNAEALGQFKAAVESVQKVDTEKFGVNSLEYLMTSTAEDNQTDQDMLTSFSHMKH